MQDNKDIYNAENGQGENKPKHIEVKVEKTVPNSQKNQERIDELNPFSFLNISNIAYAFRTLWRNSILIILLSLILAGVVGYLSIKPQKYEAEAIIRILQIPASDEYYSEHVSQEAEMEVLKSYELIDKTLDKLQRNVLVTPKLNKQQLVDRFVSLLQKKLDNIKIEEDSRVDIETFIMPPALDEENFDLIYKGDNRFALEKKGKLKINGVTKASIESKGIKLNIENIYGKAGDVFSLKAYSQYDLVNYIQSKLEIRKRGLEKFSGVLRITFEDSDKHFINSFLKEFIKTYRQSTYDRITKELRNRITQHELDLQNIDTKISLANVEMHEVQQQYKTIDHESEANLHLKNLIELEKRQIEIKTSLGKVSSTYTDKHPTVISLKKQLKILAAKIADIKDKISQIPDIHKKKFTITNNIESLKESRIIITEDLVRLKSRLQSTKNYITIVNGPQTVHKPYVKSILKITFIAFIFGLFLTSLIVVLKSFITRNKKSKHALNNEVADA